MSQLYTPYYPCGYVPWLQQNDPYAPAYPHHAPVHYQYQTSPSVCLDYLKGVCTGKRFRCKFAHPPMPDLPILPEMTAEPHGHHAHHQHPAAQLHPHAEEPQVCSVWVLTGFCKFGHKCRFQHPPIDEATAVCAPAITAKMVAFMAKQAGWAAEGYDGSCNSEEGISSECDESAGSDDGRANTATPPPTPSADAASPRSPSSPAWQPQQGLADDALARRVVGILNRITPEKFGALAQQLVDLVGHDDAALAKALSLVFAKGSAEEHLGEVYSRLCKCLFSAVPPRQRPFVCTTLLQLARHPIYDAAELVADSAADGPAAVAKVQTKRLSNVRFLGQLFLDDLVDTTSMLEIIDYISQSCCDDQLDPVEAVTSIELLCKLLTHVGQRLDATWKDVVEPYYQLLQSIAPRQSGRVQVLIRNLTELRTVQQWVPRREEDKPQPLTAEGKPSRKPCKTIKF